MQIDATRIFSTVSMPWQMDKFGYSRERIAGRLLSLSLALCPLSYANANEQDSPSYADIPDAISIESITITATKQDTDLLNTPVAVSVFVMDKEHSVRFERMSDVSSQVPGLNIGNTGNSAYPAIFLRGVGTADPSVGSEPSVGFYVDDVYIGRGMAMFTDLFDLERIEVIKGPQGALWGRNTTGGAIHLITQKPGESEGYQLRLGLGDFSDMRVSGTYAQRLTDQLHGKVSFNKHKRDGYTNNLFPGDRLNDADNLSLRAALLHQVSDESEWLYRADYTRDRSTSAGFDPLITGLPVLGGEAGDFSVSDFPLGHVEPEGAFTVNHNPGAYEHRDIYGVSGKYSLSSKKYSLVSITAFRGAEFENFENTDGLSLELTDLTQKTEQRQFSQEVRLTIDGSNGKQWMFGSFYFYENIDDELGVSLQGFNSLLSSVYGVQDYRMLNNSEVDGRSYAVFGNLKVPLSEELQLDLGLRYSKEVKEFTYDRQSNDVFEILLPPSVSETKLEDSWDGLSPSLTLTYSPEMAMDSIYYASVSRGFRSGGYNSFQTTLGPSFDPENLTAYQAGYKGRLLENRLQIEATAFLYKHEDMQVPTVIPEGSGNLSLVTTNAASATEQGFELALRALPTDSFQIDASVNFLDATYDQFINASGVDVSGNKLNYSSKHSAVFGAEYFSESAGGLNGRFRLEYSVQSKVYFTETNIEELMQPRHFNINCYLELSSDDSPLSATFYSKNLTDEVVISSAVDFLDILGTVSRVYNPPRTYGVEFKLDFDSLL